MRWLTEHCGGRAFLTPSCTASLELSFRLTISPGDEVIVPSFSFPSCSNAVILAGGTPVYVDVTPETLNLGEFEKSITGMTRAVLPLHYSGVSCDMDRVIQLSREYGLWVIEDAAQCIGNWKLKGDLGCISFHSTKNVECGEGGALIVSRRLEEEAELLVDCGTTKAKFRRGETDGYDWLGVGTSCLLSPHLTERLQSQFDRIGEITEQRLRAWKVYRKLIEAPKASHPGNGHIFWFLTEDQRGVITRLRGLGVKAASHYEAAHLTKPGMKYGRVYNPIRNAQYISERIVRLPTNVTEEEATRIANLTNEILHHQKRHSESDV